jgi:hypothetical protein
MPKDSINTPADYLWWMAKNISNLLPSWGRACTDAVTTILEELNTLRVENKLLKEKLKSVQDNLAMRVKIEEARPAPSEPYTWERHD